MQALFISDIHLSESEPALTAGFVHFLRSQAAEADALYILGDLFEFWIGDDDVNPLMTQIAQELATLSQSGTTCYFVHGNRDFLLKKHYAAQSELILLPEESVVTIGSQSVLILHGDTLCTDDIHYQRFRRIVNCRAIQWIFLHLPIFFRRRFAAKLRHKSMSEYQAKAPELMDVNQQAVIAALKRHNVTTMIHGHTHKLDIHPLFFDGKSGKRIVLGDWHQTGSFVTLTESELTLSEFTLDITSPN